MRQLVSHLSRKLSMTKNCPRPKIMILGTGWGGYSVLQNINQSMYDLVVISPRNHFLFTPLLCSTTVGTLEFRSIIQPVRKSTYQNAYEFYLAKAISLDLINQNVSCQSILNPDLKYELKYDKLVIAVGANNNTFGVPGVEEHAFFLKEVADARRIRNKIIDNFELALQPNISDEKRKQLLHTVIVGGGPTGVEFGAELYDFVEQMWCNQSQVTSDETPDTVDLETPGVQPGGQDHLGSQMEVELLSNVHKEDVANLFSNSFTVLSYVNCCGPSQNQSHQCNDIARL